MGIFYLFKTKLNLKHKLTAGSIDHSAHLSAHHPQRCTGSTWREHLAADLGLQWSQDISHKGLRLMLPLGSA